MVIIKIAYSLRNFSKINPRIMPPESTINTRDLNASLLSKPFRSLISALFNHSGRLLSFTLRNEPAIPGIIIVSNMKPHVMPPAIFRALIISFLEVVPLKISLRARNPRRGMQNSAITRIIVTARNLL